VDDCAQRLSDMAGISLKSFGTVTIGYLLKLVDAAASSGRHRRALLIDVNGEEPSMNGLPCR